ncbi:MAG: HAMP domain-containing histidine kinase [Planctomycetes bacterium]|nr:HAMP domain-containing histidine kinase [Planctomycetota bacterium]
MTSSQKSKLAAVSGYLLVAVLVLGGMGWASDATFELAKRNIEKEKFRSVLVAVSEMDSYMRSILRSEKQRPFTDYSCHHSVEYQEVLDENHERVDASLVVAESPLKKYGPPYAWIDLNFQTYDNGERSSPQLGQVRPGVELNWETEREHRAAKSMAWFRGRMSHSDLIHEVKMAKNRHDLQHFGRRLEPGKIVMGDASRARPRHDGERGRKGSDFQRRTKSNIEAQQKPWRAPQQCAHVIEQETDSYGRTSFRTREEVQYVCADPPDLGISPDPMSVFWLPPFLIDEHKLAFVRVGFYDGHEVVQGFIGDWRLLRKELLEQVVDLFPTVELERVATEEWLDTATSDSTLSSIPARLVVPQPDGSVAAAAWASISGQLYLTWTITAAVLLLAGWGVHNLVALTNRRMQFAYAVTHELRTPLTTFRLYADMLAGGLVPEDAKQGYLDTLNVESLRLSTLVESILEYARLENHRVRLNPVETDGAALLSKIVEEVQERCLQHGVEAKTENGVANGRAFHTDVSLINQVAGVLINNACRHLRNVDRPQVLVRLSSENAELYLDVIDNGPGIDRRDARLVFRPFRRGQAAKATAQGGIGLGLALAREWARLLGGRLDLAARHHPVLGGAHFRLTVPTRI